MSKKFMKTPLALAVGAALTASLAGSAAQAGTFEMTTLASAYMAAGDPAGADAKAKEGEQVEEKGKEGSCGADKEKGKEGSCGADKEKGKEGSCGADKEKGKEGSCGGEKGKEGSCGGDKAKEKGKEGSCGGEKKE